MSTTFISAIIPTLNEEKYLESCLKAIKNQTFRNFETIVDAMSTDSTLNVAKKYTDKILVVERKGAGHGRNCGAAIAKGEILIFVDADTIVPSHLFDSIACILRNKKIVGGNISLWPMETSKLYEVLFKVGNLISHISISLRFPLMYTPAICCFLGRSLSSGLVDFVKT